MNKIISSASEMEKLGIVISQASNPGMKIHLSGTLGAGKTTLVRGFLRGLGYIGKVKSPTFTLVEPYEFDAFSVFHFDLYRIESSLELEAIGYREYPGSDSICLIEWPEKADDYLEIPDLLVKIQIENDNRIVDILDPGGVTKPLITKISSQMNH